jgi:hypothetical protein
MSPIRQEITRYIRNISDSKLEALKPLLEVLANETVVVETDLTDEERALIAKGRAEYERGGFIPLGDIV